MGSFANKDRLLMWLLMGVVCLSAHIVAFGQGPCGGKPCPVIVIPRTAPPVRPIVRPTPRPPSGGGTVPAPQPVEPPEPTNCEDAELVVVCGMPGCEVVLEGRPSPRAKYKELTRVVTDDLGGFSFQVPGEQQYKVSVSKPGYGPFSQEVEKLDCDDNGEVRASLPAKPVTLRVRTHPAESEIFLDGQKQAYGRSDASGLFSYLLTKPTLLIEARKPGYLSATKTVFLAPELAQREIALSLEPIKATLRINANVEAARVNVDGADTGRLVTDPILLAPGKHTISTKALGYAPAEFELSVGPAETVNRNLALERLPVNSLQAQAESFLTKRAFDDVLKLARFMLEADGSNAAANRLLGQVYLQRGELSKAETHFANALAGGETIMLSIRRHPGEKFEMNKGHESCDAFLVFGKTDLEFRGVRNVIENFKVPYAQVQIAGLQLKSNVAAYLKTKVTVNGKSRDYNFYSFDRELSQAGKPYLEMVQRLIKPH